MFQETDLSLYEKVSKLLVECILPKKKEIVNQSTCQTMEKKWVELYEKNSYRSDKALIDSPGDKTMTSREILILLDQLGMVGIKDGQTSVQFIVENLPGKSTFLDVEVTNFEFHRLLKLVKNSTTKNQ